MPYPIGRREHVATITKKYFTVNTLTYYLSLPYDAYMPRKNPPLAKGPRGWNLKDPNKWVPRLQEHPLWKGDAANPGTKRARIRRRLKLGDCELCSKKAVDRHHKDGNTGNNKLSNIQQLCRKCHMLVDGRLEAFRQIAGKSTPIVPASPCSHCRTVYKPLRLGLCAACSVYLARTGKYRSKRLIELQQKRNLLHES